MWHSPSLTAQGALAHGKVITQTEAGTAFYEETNGRLLTTEKAVFSDWFAGDSLAYTVASVRRKSAKLYAYRSSGQKVWSRTVGPSINPMGWPHAVTRSGLYIATLKPAQGVEALNPETGRVLWKRALGGVQRLAVANNLLFVVTASLTQPLRLVILHAETGKPVGAGAIAFPSGYDAFPTANELMVANGMVFIRAVGPGNITQLLALGPK
jgi:outer membrane protein assembly factor BamB